MDKKARLAQSERRERVVEGTRTLIKLKADEAKYVKKLARQASEGTRRKSRVLGDPRDAVDS